MSRKGLLALWLAMAATAGPTAATAAPANDHFADAEVIAALPFATTASIAGATSELLEPGPCGGSFLFDSLFTSTGMGETVWYRFTAPTDGDVVADTLGSNFETLVTVYRGTRDPFFPGWNLEVVACNQLYGNTFQSKVSFSATAGEPYYFQIELFGDSGTLSLHVDHPGAIAGTVTKASGEPIPNVGVSLYVAAYEECCPGTDLTAPDGTYSFAGLSPGSFKVRFVPPNTPVEYAAEWFDDKPDFAHADPVAVVGGATTPVDAVLEPPPPDAADMAVTGISVVNVPIVTDYGPVGYTGWRRKVTVTVANLGEEAAEDAFLEVRACSATWSAVTGYCSSRPIGYERFDSVVPGETLTRTYLWDGLGSAGDFTVEAYTDADNDANDDNNRAAVDHYVIVGGLGLGV